MSNPLPNRSSDELEGTPRFQDNHLSRGFPITAALEDGPTDNTLHIRLWNQLPNSSVPFHSTGPRRSSLTLAIPYTVDGAGELPANHPDLLGHKSQIANIGVAVRPVRAEPAVPPVVISSNQLNWPDVIMNEQTPGWISWKITPWSTQSIWLLNHQLPEVPTTSILRELQIALTHVPTGFREHIAARIYLHFQQIPGFSDYTLAVPLAQAPLVTRGQTTGIGLVPDGDGHDQLIVKGKADLKGGLATPEMKVEKIQSPAEREALIINNDIDLGNNRLKVGSITPPEDTAVTIRSNTHLEKNLQLRGRLKDEHGAVVPVGSVLPHVGNLISGAPTPPPPGWLLCDGAKVRKDEYPDLYECIGWGPVSTKVRENFTIPFRPIGFFRNYFTISRWLRFDEPVREQIRILTFNSATHLSSDRYPDLYSLILWWYVGSDDEQENEPNTSSTISISGNDYLIKINLEIKKWHHFALGLSIQNTSVRLLAYFDGQLLLSEEVRSLSDILPDDASVQDLLGFHCQDIQWGWGTSRYPSNIDGYKNLAYPNLPPSQENIQRLLQEDRERLAELDHSGALPLEAIRPYFSERLNPSENSFQQYVTVSMWLRLDESSDEDEIDSAFILNFPTLYVEYRSGEGATEKTPINRFRLSWYLSRENTRVSLYSRQHPTNIQLETKKWHHFAIGLSVQSRRIGLSAYFDGQKVLSTRLDYWLPLPEGVSSDDILAYHFDQVTWARASNLNKSIYRYRIHPNQEPSETFIQQLQNEDQRQLADFDLLRENPRFLPAETPDREERSFQQYFTISTWLRLDRPDEDLYRILNIGGCNAKYRSVDEWITRRTFWNYEVYWSIGQNSNIKFFNRSSRHDYDIYETNIALEPKKWHHFAVGLSVQPSSITVKAFFDGREVLSIVHDYSLTDVVNIDRILTYDVSTVEHIRNTTSSKFNNSIYKYHIHPDLEPNEEHIQQLVDEDKERLAAFDRTGILVPEATRITGRPHLVERLDANESYFRQHFTVSTWLRFDEPPGKQYSLILELVGAKAGEGNFTRMQDVKLNMELYYNGDGKLYLKRQKGESFFISFNPNIKQWYHLAMSLTVDRGLSKYIRVFIDGEEKGKRSFYLPPIFDGYEYGQINWNSFGGQLYKYQIHPDLEPTEEHIRDLMNEDKYHFFLPDLRGRFLRGAVSGGESYYPGSPSRLYQTGGSEQHLLAKRSLGDDVDMLNVQANMDRDGNYIESDRRDVLNNLPPYYPLHYIIKH